MSEDRRRHDHLRVITALEDFQVRATSQRRFDLDAHLARLERRRLDVLDADIFFAIKNGALHLIYGLLDN